MKLKEIFLLFAFLWIALPGALRGASDEGNVYFNAATENYLQGNFTTAIENLEKAQAAEPENPKIKNFMVKILLEAATQNSWAETTSRHSST